MKELTREEDGDQKEGDQGDSTNKIEDSSDNNADDKIKTVVVSLLRCCMAPEEEVGRGAAASLALIGKNNPISVLTEWHTAFVREKEVCALNSNSPQRRDGRSSVPPCPNTCGLLISSLAPVLDLLKNNSLKAGDARHRAVLGQILALLVDEMTSSPQHGQDSTGLSEIQQNCLNILSNLSGTYMDKVMDVVLVHYQVGSSVPVHPSIITTLGSLAHHHPHHAVPFLKAILGTTSYLIKAVKQTDAASKTAYAIAMMRFCDAILDYVSNIAEMPDTTIKVTNYSHEANAIYETFFSTWLNQTKEVKVKLKILECLAAVTPLLSTDLIDDRGCQFVSSLLGLYKKLGPAAGSNVEITLCLSSLLDTITKKDCSSVEPVVDQVLGTMFSLVCIPPDYAKPNTVKNHFEILRCYDIMVQCCGDKVVAGLQLRVDSPDEKSRIGALVVLKHILNSNKEALADKLDDIFNTLHNKLGETNNSVRKVMAQIIVMLGHHGCLEGTKGRDFLEFIIKLCALTGEDTKDTKTRLGVDCVTCESLSLMCGNILELLTTTVDSVEPVLWPHLLEYLMQPDCTTAVPSIAKSLAHIATKKREINAADYSIDYGDFQYTPSPNVLLSRLVVLASVPLTQHRGVHILRFLHNFSSNINKHLVELWDARFPLLMHYLEQHDTVDLEQWHNWLLTLLTDSLAQIGMEEWSCGVAVALVNQLPMYEPMSPEKSFAIRCVGHVLTLVTNKQVVLDNLSAMFVAAVDCRQHAHSCAVGFGVTSSKHLELVLAKIDTLYKASVTKKSTSFFGLIRDKSSEESQCRTLSLLLGCLGQAAKHASTTELGVACEGMVKHFLAPCLSNCRESNQIREAALIAVSNLALALHKLLKDNDKFLVVQHEELLHSTIAVLYDTSVSLSCKQLALTTLTNLIQLPPNISQLTRCSLLKACFSTIFNSFLEAEEWKGEDYSVVKDLEQQLTTMVEKLHVLIRELLRQDMEQSTVDEIFTMLEPWLKLDQALSRELSVNILLGALETYCKNVKLGIESPTNFTPGPYMIGAMVPRCHDPSLPVRTTALQCLQHLLRILAIYEGLAQETIEKAIGQLDAMNLRCNSSEGGSSKAELSLASQAITCVLTERVQHHHMLSLLDSITETLTDTQASSVAGSISVLHGLATARGSEIFQNIPGLVTKLHDKMTIMAVDEGADMLTEVGCVIHQLASHNSRGCVSSLLHLELPIDPCCRVAWVSTAGDHRLASELLDILLEVISQDQVVQLPTGKLTANHSPLAAASALTVLFDTHKLEDICRQEVGHILSSLVVLLSHYLVASHVPQTSDSVQVTPTVVALECIRSLFSTINCVVVANSVVVDTEVRDYKALCRVLQDLLANVIQHAPHHTQAIVNSIIPNSYSGAECCRVASLAVLSGVVGGKAGGDLALLAKVMTCLLKCVSDTCAEARQLALEGLSGLDKVTQEEIQNNGQAVLSALIQGVEDESSPLVTLTALRGLASLLPSLPAPVVHHVQTTIALKVRPFFESSSEDHRAASINVYGALAVFAEGEHASLYIDQSHSILVPLLLHSSSTHQDTSRACLSTLAALAGVTRHEPLIENVAKYNAEQPFSDLVESIVECQCPSLTEMFATFVANGISYFRSGNPMLRKNAVLLLKHLVCYNGTGDCGVVDSSLLCAVTSGLVELLQDKELDVRAAAASNLGQIVEKYQQINK